MESVVVNKKSSTTRATTSATPKNNNNKIKMNFVCILGLIRTDTILVYGQRPKCSPPGYHICQKALNPEGTVKQEQHQQKQRVREHSNFYKNKK